MANILIFAAHSSGRQFVASSLRGQGHSVVHVGDAEEALRLVRVQRPDLLIVDLATPDADGCRFMMRTRCQLGALRPRVLLRAATGAEAEARALAHALGASFVVKPTSAELLRSVVDAALREPPPQDGRLELDNNAVDALLQPIVRLTRRVAGRDAELEVARTALDLEIRKRIWAEQDLMRANLRLQDQAMRDAVTGLHNRRFLEESLLHEEIRARRHGHTLAIMMVDVDRFKEFNDTLGHLAGDAVLKSVGECMLAVARGEDIVARFGGDEFALMMASTSPETAWHRAQLIRQRVHNLEIGQNGSQLGPVTLSVGIAVLPQHGDSAEAVLRAADDALLQSKQAGRDRIVISRQRAATTAAPAEELLLTTAAGP
ncbi:MAG TPA: diguanylate cyclase [Steroidobacteraceae bacterium]|nr:diguanylate cyclase [Steroidobacteraceae bacterium]